MKFFCTAGPVTPEEHYCLPLATRFNEQELMLLIEQKKYFILHAPRQTGKTSMMINFARKLNQEGKYIALYVNIESGQAARGNFNMAMPIILQEFHECVSEQLPDQKKFFEIFYNLKEEGVPAGSLLATLLSRWSAKLDKPLVIFIDEIDCLVGDTLISALRQLRLGYAKRPQNFPQTACLIGLRDVRDYRIWSDVEHQIVLGGSAFNIKAESLRLADFTAIEVKELYLQHTQATGQKFIDDAIDYVFELTQGQPWLVNAIAYQACFKDVVDRSKAITKEDIEKAKEVLIKRRDTHLDVLVDRLHEPRVRNIIDAIITGIDTSVDFPIDDIQYVIDLGLVSKRENNLIIANPIYQEIIPRELTYSTQLTMPQQQSWYLKPDGGIDIPKLLRAFTDFFRENSDAWLEKFDYKEAGPHLLLMAFLQRIINGGGKIDREYALGRDRVDLLVFWKIPLCQPVRRSSKCEVGDYGGQDQKIVIELKIWRGPQSLAKGLSQTAEYMDTSNATEGHLVIFDKREKSWDEKIYNRQETFNNKTIIVWGM
ncbi:AAA-like domain-containing protein [Candidatus Babeliales bacterium]|nr:AAA-like domain-containing protein [Candidatus Babeliales bacterium]